MGETGVWRTSSMEGKWKDGKGDIALRIVEYYGNVWLDLRIMNVSDGTIEQAQEMLPRLAEGIQQAQDILEKTEREKND